MQRKFIWKKNFRMESKERNWLSINGSMKEETRKLRDRGRGKFNEKRKEILNEMRKKWNC